MLESSAFSTVLADVERVDRRGVCVDQVTIDRDLIIVSVAVDVRHVDCDCGGVEAGCNRLSHTFHTRFGRGLATAVPGGSHVSFGVT